MSDESRPHTEPEEQHDEARLLILLAETDLPAELRSGARTIRRWRHSRGNGTCFDGDADDPATYEWARGAEAVTAVIDLQPPERARAALEALRSVRPDAAVLLLSGEDAEIDGPRDGTLARRGRLRDVLRIDIEDELVRLEAERRVYVLRRFAAGPGVVPILIHNDPDPDAVSSALAVATLLDGPADRNPIVTLDPMTRPENRRMAELLHIRVTQITRDELLRFERIITVDTQPRGLQRERRPRFAVIDHHPAERDYSADFADIRPHYGATATMLTEYLRATDEKRIPRALATALLFGIRTDTDLLMRGVTPADVEAYAFLQARADLELMRRIERPAFAAETAQAFGEALAGVRRDDELIVAWLGELEEDEAHVLSDLADFCLTIENVTWVVVAALLDGGIVFTIRHAGAAQPGAGDLARRLAGDAGSGGGHATMARAVLPLGAVREVIGADEKAPAVLAKVRRALDGLAGPSSSRRGSRPARRA